MIFYIDNKKTSRDFFNKGLPVSSPLYPYAKLLPRPDWSQITFLEFIKGIANDVSFGINFSTTFNFYLCLKKILLVQNL